MAFHVRDKSEFANRQHDKKLTESFGSILMIREPNNEPTFIVVQRPWCRKQEHGIEPCTPTGKRNLNESKLHCCLRETSEETGLTREFIKSRMLGVYGKDNWYPVVIERVYDYLSYHGEKRYGRSLLILCELENTKGLNVKNKEGQSELSCNNRSLHAICDSCGCNINCNHICDCVQSPTYVEGEPGKNCSIRHGIHRITLKQLMNGRQKQLGIQLKEFLDDYSTMLRLKQ